MKAVIFPGQGAQYVGMGKSLYDNFAEAKAIFDQADQILGFSLSEKCFSGTEQQLKDTALQQLAILTVSLASFEILKKTNPQIAFVSGLSLGEYSCLYAANVLSLSDVLTLVRERAQAMQQAAEQNPSTMFAVIDMPPEQLQALAQKESFYVANMNAPGQIVISLALSDRERIKKIFEDHGVRAVELEVSGGFHSPFMQPAQDHLTTVVQQLAFNDASIPVVSNVTAKPHSDREIIKSNLLTQLTSPVLWCECAQYMIGQGVDVFYETGPSRVLRGLMRKIDKSVTVVNLEKQEDFSAVIA